ncbi:MAG: prolyl oligopeptidase family serine peptidase [Ruminiclostridium sp.]
MCRNTEKIIAAMAACSLLSGCAGQSAQNESKQDSMTEIATIQEISESTQDEATAETDDIQQETAVSAPKVTTITEVFGDGEKPSAAAIEYPTEIDASSLSTDDFEVENQTIEGIFTNSEAGITDSNVPGRFVILKFAYENTESAGGSMGREQGGNPDRGGMDGGFMHGGTEGEFERNGGVDGGMKPGMGADVDGGMVGGDAGVDGGRGNAQGQSFADLTVTVLQKGEISGTDGTVYQSSDDALENGETIRLGIQDFELFEYTDPDTGYTIPYSLYLPDDYDESKEYPLLFFVADAGANSDDPIGNLTQGNGATVWVTPEEQAKHECIVLSPQYTNTLVSSIGSLTTDENIWTDGLTLVSDLLHYVIEEYSVDENRIYGTGQSQGCMTNIALSDKYPDLFAAQLLVAGQWNVEEMAAMKDKNLWIVVCEGDSKAYPGMNEATASWEALGSSVARSDMWDSTASPEQLDKLVAQTESQGCKINYTVFEGGNHTYTWTVAYNIEGLRDWLFAQTK